MPEPRAGDDADAEAGRDPGRRRTKRRSWARRRHLGLITFGVAVLVLVVGVLAIVLTWDNGRTPLSQQATALGTGSAGPSGTTSVPATSPSPTTVVSVPASVTGVITAIGDNTMTVKELPTGRVYNVVVTATTQFKRYRGFDTFEVDMPVIVRGTLSAGVVTATSITRAV